MSNSPAPSVLMRVKGPKLVGVALGITLLAWASAFAGIRAGLRSYSPGQLALFRFLVSSTLLGLLVFPRTREKLQTKDMGLVILSGVTGYTLYHLLLNSGERTVSAGAASLLVSTVPLITTALSTIFLRERPGVLLWMGLAISLVGVSLVARGESRGIRFSGGTWVVLGAALMQAIYFVAQKPLLARYSVLTVTAWTMWVGTCGLLFFAPGLFRSLQIAESRSTWAAIYLGIGPSAIAMYAWAYVLSKLPASRASPYLLLIPALSIAIAWFWLGEIPSPLSVLGGAVTLTGVAISRAHLRSTRWKWPASRSFS